MVSAHSHTKGEVVKIDFEPVYLTARAIETRLNLIKFNFYLQPKFELSPNRVENVIISR